MVGPLLSLTSAHYPRAQRLSEAATAAFERIAPGGSVHVLDGARAMFPALGETLMWLTALDDILLSVAKPTYGQRQATDADGAVVPGIRYARNAVVHGELVVAATMTTGAAMGSVAMGSTFAGGQLPSILWLPRSSIQFTARKTNALPRQLASYDSELAGADVRPTLQRGLAFLRDAAGT